MKITELEQKYDQVFHDAMALDEEGCLAQKANDFATASRKFREASSLYAQAAGLMMDIGDACFPTDMVEIKKSVERLTAASQEVKELSILLAKNPSTATTSKAVPLPEEDEDENSLFLPMKATGVTFDDIAGLEDAKKLVKNTITNPLLYPDLYERFNIQGGGGLLLFGPPGGGKTMMARAIASHVNMPFFSIKCSDIVGRYFGESEKHVKSVCEAARREGNAVVFFDEAEALAVRRGGNSTVMNRLVPELLAQMDGFDKHDGHVIFIFATNRPYDIDPAFLRPGRLPHHCYIPLPDSEVRRELLTSRISKVPCQGEINIEELVEKTKRFSCADIVHLVERCCIPAIERGIKTRESGLCKSEEFLTKEDLDEVLPTLHPSVEPEEIAKLEKWMKKLGIQYKPNDCE